MHSGYPTDELSEGEAYHRELMRRFPDEEDRMAFIESQVEGASDFSRPFTDPNEPDNSEW